MHVSLGVHILISIRLNLFALLSTATRTWPTQELSNAQLGTPDRVLQRSCMSSYSLSLPVSIVITQNSFRSVWTSPRYSAQPPAPNPHESSPMCSLEHPIGSCKGPAWVAIPYLFLWASRSLGIASGLFGLVRTTQHSHPHPTHTRALWCTPDRVLRRSGMCSSSLSLPECLSHLE